MVSKTNEKISESQKLLNYIKNNGIVSVKDLRKALNFSSERNVRKNIEILRKQGYPICIAKKGCFCSENIEDIKNTIQKIFSQVNGQLETAKNLDRIVKAIEAGNFGKNI